MDCSMTDKTLEMVKMTIKRGNDPTEDKKWVCQRIDDDPELEPTSKTAHRVNESLPVDDENPNEATKDSWYPAISSYLEVEMKEMENPQPSCESSAENDTNAQHPTDSQEITDSTNNSCNDPMDLSASYSKNKSRRDATNDASNKSPVEAHASISRFLWNDYADHFNNPSLAGTEGIIQGKAASHLPAATWPQTASTSLNQMQMNSREAVAMTLGTMPSINQNFSMPVHRNSPISSGFVSSEKLNLTAKGGIRNHLQPEEPRPSKTHYGHFSAGATTSNTNGPYNWPLGSESNASGFPIRSEYADGIRENFVNLPQKTVNLKRPSQSCAQIGSYKARKSVPLKKKNKARTEVPSGTYHCNVCVAAYKTEKGYITHLSKEKHLRNLNQAGQQPSNLHNFQPNIPIRTFVPTGLQVQQPRPPLLPLMGNQMWNYQMLQANKMTAANQYGGVGTIINDADVQKTHPDRSKSESLDPIRSLKEFEVMCYAPYQRQMNLPIYHTSNPEGVHLLPRNPQSEISMTGEISESNKESLDRIRSQKELKAKSYAPYQRQMKLPVYHTGNPEGVHLLPRNPQSEISRTANHKYLENKAFQSSRSHKGPSSQIQPENLTEAGSFKKSKNAQSVAQSPQMELFRVYHCLVCSKFHTDDLKELELHVSTDRSKIPFEMIIVSGNDLICKLCSFKTKISEEMGQHVACEIHLNRVQYYNHIMEGGINIVEKLKDMHMFTPVFLFCSGCEFSTRSMDTLKAHSLDPSHQHNVSCCMYVSMFKQLVEYCYCRLCSVRTLTKRDLVVHIRSEKHINALKLFQPADRTLLEPSRMFFIKESGSYRNEQPRVLDQFEGSTFIESENSHLKKKNNEKSLLTENPAPVDLSSGSSNSLQHTPVCCTLCQQVLPGINVLEQHLQRIHGVNESGVKWIVSAVTEKDLRVHEEKSSPAEKLKSTNTGKLKSIVFSSQKSSATDKKLPIDGMSIDSSSYQSSVAAGQNVASKSPTSHRVVAHGRDVTVNENFTPEIRTDTVYPSQLLDEAERMRNPGGSGTDDSAKTQQSSARGGTRNSRMPNQNPDFEQERVNTESPSRQEFRKTENMLPAGEEKVQNFEENLNYNSSPAEVIVEYASEPIGDSKNETETDCYTSELVSATEHGLPKSQSGLNARRKRNDSSSDHHPPTMQQFHETEKMLPVGDGKILDSGSSHVKTIVECASESNGDGKHKTKPDGSSSEYFSAHSHVSPSDHTQNREGNDDESTDQYSLTQERFPAIDDSSSEHGSPIPQSRLNAGSESKNYVTYERSPSTDDSSSEHFSALPGSPISQSGQGMRKGNQSSSSDIFVEYEWLNGQEIFSRAERGGASSSQGQQYVFDSEHRISPLENIQNSNLRRNVVKDSPIYRSMTFAESKQEADNISVTRKSSDTMNDLYECPTEYDTEFSAPDSPEEIDPQIQARKNIQNIEITDVFSLTNRFESSSSSDDDEEDLDFGNIDFSDLDDL